MPRTPTWTGARAPIGSTDEWYTPPELFTRLGLDFDLDPAAPPGGVPWIPARTSYSRAEDGLAMPWSGRVWLNPPYGRDVGRWIRRLADHGDGIALTFARTDTKWFVDACARATVVAFITGRLRFRRFGGEPGAPAMVPSVLLAYGLSCALAVAESDLGPTLWVPQGVAARQSEPAPLVCCAIQSR